MDFEKHANRIIEMARQLDQAVRAGEAPAFLSGDNHCSTGRHLILLVMAHKFLAGLIPKIQQSHQSMHDLKGREVQKRKSYIEDSTNIRAANLLYVIAAYLLWILSRMDVNVDRPNPVDPLNTYVGEIEKQFQTSDDSESEQGEPEVIYEAKGEQ